MLHRNLGKLDRVLRFALAFWWLGPWAPSYPSPWSWLVLVVAWIALLESFTGWCWMHDAFHINNKDQ